MRSLSLLLENRSFMTQRVLKTSQVAAHLVDQLANNGVLAKEKGRPIRLSVLAAARKPKFLSNLLVRNPCTAVIVTSLKETVTEV